jgi:hypothetical protein
VIFFDSNKNFHAHPNKEIGNGGHFLSILDLEFSVQFISELTFLHPNRPLKLNLHANSVSMNVSNTVITNAIEKSKLGEAGFVKHDIFISQL